MLKTKGYNNHDYNNFYGTLSFKHELPFILKGLSVSGMASYRKYYDFQKTFSVPYTTYDFNDNNEITGTKVNGADGLETSLKEYFGQSQEITYNLSLNYAQKFGKHDINVLLLTEGFTSNKDNLEGYRTKYNSNAIDQLFAGGEDARLGYVGRINYNYAERYLVEFSARYDGSANFPKGKRFGFFPAFSLGWRLSEEAFWKNMDLSFVDQLKLRGSYGLVGNDLGFVDACGSSFCSHTGYYIRKGINEKNTLYDRQTGCDQSFIEIRYAEVLLNYAEALNEHEGPSDDVFDALDEVRHRAGITTDVKDILKDTKDRKEVRELIYNERRVELCFEQLDSESRVVNKQ